MTKIEIGERIQGCASPDFDEDGPQSLEWQSIWTMIQSMLSNCFKKEVKTPAELKEMASKQPRKALAAIMRASKDDKNFEGLKHRERKRQCEAILYAAQDATLEEIEECCELAKE